MGMLVELDRFKTDMDGAEAEADRVDQKRGAVLGVKSTPTIFINDRQLSGPVTVADVRTAVVRP
jgi:protein-disulfide isomerase